MNKVYSTYPGIYRVKSQPRIPTGLYNMSILAGFISIPTLFLPWLRLKALFYETTLNGMGVVNIPLMGDIRLAPQESYIFPLLIMGVILVAGAGLAFKSNFFFWPLTILSGLETGFLVWKVNNPVVGFSILSNIPVVSFQPEIGLAIEACSAVATLILALSGIIYQWFRR